jgi:hypothetical protein
VQPGDSVAEPGGQPVAQHAGLRDLRLVARGFDPALEVGQTLGSTAGDGHQLLDVAPPTAGRLAALVAVQRLGRSHQPDEEVARRSQREPSKRRRHRALHRRRKRRGSRRPDGGRAVPAASASSREGR